jgi:hypothetical protein
MHVLTADERMFVSGGSGFTVEFIPYDYTPPVDVDYWVTIPTDPNGGTASGPGIEITAQVGPDTTVGDIVQGTWDGIVHDVTQVIDMASEFGAWVGGEISDFAGDVWNTVTEFASTAWDAMLDVGSYVFESVGNLFESAWDSVTSWFGGWFGGGGGGGGGGGDGSSY